MDANVLFLGCFLTCFCILIFCDSDANARARFKTVKAQKNRSDCLYKLDELDRELRWLSFISMFEVVVFYICDGVPFFEERTQYKSV